MIVRLPSAPEQEIKGIVEEISPSLESRDDNPGNARFLKIRIGLQDKPTELRPGLEADVEGSRTLAKDVWLVSRSAIFQDGDESYLMVVRNEAASKLPVEVGASSPETVEVEGNLNSDLKLITLGAEKIEEGQKVQVSQP